MISARVVLVSRTGITDSHQAYFESTSAQSSWFLNKAIWQSTGTLSYQREHAFFACPVPYDQIQGAEWLMYQNTTVSNKWYYGRITLKEWINENLTNVHFEIDNFQTYQKDITIGACFVEREHVNGDWNGDFPTFVNTLDEGLEIDDYYVLTEDIDDLGSNVYVVAYNQDTDGNVVNGSEVTGVYSACSYFITDTAQDVNNFLRSYDGAGVGSAILAIMIVPEMVLDGRGATKYVGLPTAWYSGYKPKNGKCFASPYNMIVVESPSGDSGTYAYEHFAQPEQVSFYRDSSFSLQAASRMVPDLYKNFRRWQEEAVIFNNFPQAAWTSDAYANWLAQNTNTVQATIGASIAATAIGIATANPAVVAGGLISANSSLARIRDRSVSKSQARGEVTTSTANITWGRNGFAIKRVQIKQESIIRIDDFFSAYGYKVNLLKIPNVRTRPYWNHVKTSDAIITGACPAVAVDAITQMFNRGLTLWHVDKGAVIGNYTMDNKG